jgi:hypothetical protein
LQNYHPSYVHISSSLCNPMHQSEPYSHKSSWRAKTNTNKLASSYILFHF